MLLLVLYWGVTWNQVIERFDLLLKNLRPLLIVIHDTCGLLIILLISSSDIILLSAVRHFSGFSFWSSLASMYLIYDSINSYICGFIIFVRDRVQWQRPGLEHCLGWLYQMGTDCSHIRGSGDRGTQGRSCSQRVILWPKLLFFLCFVILRIKLASHGASESQKTEGCILGLQLHSKQEERWRGGWKGARVHNRKEEVMIWIWVVKLPWNP